MKKIAMILAALTAALNSYGQTKQMAVTEFSENYLREKPSYTAELGTQALMGTVVEIVGKEGYWRQVVTPEPYTAWCTELGLVEMKHDRLNAYIAAPKYICTALHSRIMSRPSANSEPVSDFSMGDLVRIVYKEGKKGASVNKGWAEVMLPSGKKGWAPVKDIAVFSEWAAGRKATESDIVNTARQLVGVPYLWGGTSAKGLDCSGLTRLVWFMNGWLLPRNASQQAALGREIIMKTDHSIAPDSDGIRAEMSRRILNLKPGDLIYFGTPASLLKSESITHVGIYIGDGRFIHASHIVRISSLIPGEDDYYENSYKLLKARRLFDWHGPGLTPILKSPAYFLQ